MMATSSCSITARTSATTRQNKAAFKAKFDHELAAAQDLEGVRRDRPVPDRQATKPDHVSAPPSSASRLTRHVHVPGALPQRGRQVLRRRHHEGDDQQRYRCARSSPTCATRTSSCRRASSNGASSKISPPSSQGQTAMTISWPPYGRWAAGYGTDEKALNWVPKSTIAGKVGYALPPGGHPELAAGFCSVGRLDQQEQGRRLSVHPVAEQRR